MPYLPSQPNGTLFDVFVSYPQFSDPLHVFLQELLRGSGPFSATESELIAAYVSGLNRCNFCCTTHTSVAEGLGLKKNVVQKLVAGSSPQEVPEKITPVLEYVRKLTLAPAEVNQKDVDKILETGWGEDAVVYANLICGAFNLFNRWVEGLGIEADEKYVQATVKQLLRAEYTGVNNMVNKILTHKSKAPYRA